MAAYYDSCHFGFGYIFWCRIFIFGGVQCGVSHFSTRSFWNHAAFGPVILVPTFQQHVFGISYFGSGLNQSYVNIYLVISSLY